jgi:hypothetical protein
MYSIFHHLNIIERLELQKGVFEESSKHLTDYKEPFSSHRESE